MDSNLISKFIAALRLNFDLKIFNKISLNKRKIIKNFKLEEKLEFLQKIMDLHQNFLDKNKNIQEIFLLAFETFLLNENYLMLFFSRFFEYFDGKFTEIMNIMNKLIELKQNCPLKIHLMFIEKKKSEVIIIFISKNMINLNFFFKI